MRSFLAPTVPPARRAAAVRGVSPRAVGRRRQAAAGRRLVSALAALFALLFMQLAVASHACAGIRQAAGPGAAVAVQAGGPSSMPDCEQSSEAALPALCHAHCEDAQASLDSAAQLPAAGAVPVLPAILPPAPDRLLPAGPEPSDGFFLQRTTTPPLSIRHCCLRL